MSGLEDGKLPFSLDSVLIDKTCKIPLFSEKKK